MEPVLTNYKAQRSRRGREVCSMIVLCIFSVKLAQEASNATLSVLHGLEICNGWTSTVAARIWLHLFLELLDFVVKHKLELLQLLILLL